MHKLLIGRKIGMTQIYNDKGAAVPVTVIEAGPCVVTQLKTQATDGYTAVQLGYGTKKHPTKPILGHLAKSNQTTVGTIRELRLDTEDGLADLTLGQTLDVSLFALGDAVVITATSKGKGFSGVMKRHNFAGGPGSHGSDFHRAPGAIGGRWPQRVTKGRRMPGHMGHEQVTVKGLQIVHIDQASNLIAISGPVPGPRRGIVEIRG